MKWWVMFFMGAVLTLTPAYLNPLGMVNGMTLLGLCLLLWAGVKISEGEK
jgi:hypothetical protein